MKDNHIVFAESYQNPSGENQWANPVTLKTMVRLLPENVVKCSWPDTVENRRRTEFCQVYEGYPDVCRCEYKWYVFTEGCGPIRGVVVIRPDVIGCYLARPVLLI